ncbi:RBBP9/YdeN family alpha/beta hydrolase [Aromatoleum petrolei]|uniref:RBBP9/YdeN family alpha/beta hydrolase n=1 Tax=Aromatoleum petrolei TaxID=76116 RepID=UPI001BB6FBEF|nr:alpha/beta fold hydrolase [Aromatoleum petrolei]QTQ37759.1 Putative hydrolase [Aromatoleum petrolei]
MRHTTLIVPGFHGSGPDHWQTWLERRLPDARRVRGVDWEAPVLARWAAAVRREIDESAHSVWLVAHSFGCLASVVAAADRPERVAAALLVAPADPARFGPLGLLEEAPAQGLATAPCCTRTAVRPGMTDAPTRPLPPSQEFE